MQETTKDRLRESLLLDPSDRGGGEFTQPSLRIFLHVCMYFRWQTNSNNFTPFKGEGRTGLKIPPLLCVSSETQVTIDFVLRRAAPAASPPLDPTENPQGVPVHPSVFRDGSMG